MRKITSVILLLGCALSAGAEQTPRYVVQLQSAPLLATHGQRAALDRIEREHSDFEARAVAAGFTVIRRLTHVANVAIVEAPEGNTGRLRGMTGVRRAFPERRYQQHFDASISLHQIDSAWAAIPGATYNASDPTAWNVAGKGIKIGLVDTGIDPTHPSFSATNMAAPPSGFPKWSTNVTGNKALTNNKIIVARSYGTWTAQDVDGHGSAVASVAAGVPISSSVGPAGMTLSGVAPAAWLGIYDVDTDHTGSYSDSDILSALDDCASDGMDVISMSFGAADYGGSLDPENQLYNEIFTTLRANGTVLVASAGNSGAEPNTMSAPAVDPGVIAAGAQKSSTVYAEPAVTATDGTNISAAAADNNTGIVPSLTAPLVNVTQWESTGLGCTTPASGAAKGKILLVQRGTCTFVQKVQNAQTAGAVALIVYNYEYPATTTDQQYGYYGETLMSMDLTAASSLSAIANFPAIFIGYSEGAALASSASSNSSYTVTAVFGLGTGDTHQLAYFSSRGPDADLAIKPELVADGNSVVTAWCTNTTLDSYYNACNPYGFALMDGTSFSSPMTAGAVALVMSARPGLTVDDYRSLIVNGASAMTDDSGNTMPVQTAGAGSLDVLQAVKSSVTANPVSLSFGSAGSSVATTQQLTLKNVGSATTTYNLAFEGVTSSAVSGSAVTLDSGGTVYFPALGSVFGDYLGLSNPLPSIWTRSVTLAAGAETTVVVQAPSARSAQGTYQGFIDVTASGSSTPEARIPWWYAVPSSTATEIVLDPSNNSTTDLLYLYQSSSTGYYTGTIAVRFVDSTGVPLSAPSTISAVSLSNGAVASTPYQATSASTCESSCTSVTFPNVWLIDFTAAYDYTYYTFRITSGGLTRIVYAYSY